MRITSGLRLLSEPRQADAPFVTDLPTQPLRFSSRYRTPLTDLPIRSILRLIIDRFIPKQSVVRRR
jgi:hypothetical protein